MDEKTMQALEMIAEGLNILKDSFAEYMNAPEPVEPSPWLSRDELAKVSGFSPSFVTKIVKEMEKARIGGFIRGNNYLRINRDVFYQFMEHRNSTIS